MITFPIELANWIENETLPWKTLEDKPSSIAIKNCIPPKYESYCKIFHPFQVTPDEADILEQRNKYGQNESLTKNNGPVIDAFERSKHILIEYNAKHWDFVTWKSMAEKYGLVFYNGINPQTFVDKFRKIGWQKNLSFPREGNLPRQLLIKLLDLLKQLSPIEEVFIYQMVPHCSWKDNKYNDLVKCSYAEVLNYFETDFIGYLYSVNKSWIVLLILT